MMQRNWRMLPTVNGARSFAIVFLFWSTQVDAVSFHLPYPLTSIEANHFERTVDAAVLLTVVSPTILNLSSLPGTLVFDELERVLDNALTCLAIMEAKIDISSTPQKDAHYGNFTLPPHRAYRLHDTQEQNDPLSTWGNSVEMLWQVAMNFDTKPRSWDALTTRVLTWRRIVGADKSSIGEWARISVLQSLDNVQ